MAGNTVSSVKDNSGSGIRQILNTNPGVTAYTVVQFGHVPTSGDLPAAADYPGCFMNVGDLGSAFSLYWSDGTAWQEVSFI